MNRNKPDTHGLFSRIINLSSEAEWTREETREALSEAGVNPADLGERMLKVVARLKKASPFYWKTRAHAMRDTLLEKVRLRVSSETIGLSRQQLLGRLNEAIEQLPAPISTRYGVAFRKFEDASEEDIRSMLEEIAVIEDLEQDKS